MNASDRRDIQLGVNIDHVATIRQARGTVYPRPVDAMYLATAAGADGITIHLREDRRHIHDNDVTEIKRRTTLPLNLEMAATGEMLAIAQRVRPAECCLVPEKRAELTTEGGLDVVSQRQHLRGYCAALSASGILVSLFVDPDPAQIIASAEAGAAIIEIHTGAYADAVDDEQRLHELARVQQACATGVDAGLQVNAGHGLNYDNVDAVARISSIVCLNIGHAIVARAVLQGMQVAVAEMKRLMVEARHELG